MATFGYFDIVIGSDVVFFMDSKTSLFELCGALLDPTNSNASVLLSRNRSQHEKEVLSESATTCGFHRRELLDTQPLFCADYGLDPSFLEQVVTCLLLHSSTLSSHSSQMNSVGKDVVMERFRR